MNTRLIDNVLKIFNIKPEIEKIPGIMATVDVDFDNIIEYLAGTGTIYAVPAKGKFFITGAELTYDKVVTDTGSLARIDIISGGKTRRICQLDGTTLTIQGKSKAVRTKFLLDPTSNISISASGTFSSIHGTIYGIYYPE